MREVTIAPGYPQRALSWEDLAHKFSDCASSAGLSDESARNVFAQLHDLRHTDNVADMIDLMRQH